MRSFALITSRTYVFVLTMVLSFSLVTLPNGHAGSSAITTTPIKHLVVIFQENVSFDHYFATYPNASNRNSTEPQFHAKSDTPSVNGLTGGLLTNNPNSVNPFRLARVNASTCDNDHFYTRQQQAYNGGLMDRFVQTNVVSKGCNPALTMGYFDGNTVTALWNYAQHYSMSDNFYASTFGCST